MDGNNLCGKCDVHVRRGDKLIQCTTCKLHFHKTCTTISDLKYEVLLEENPDVFWFCKACKQTTSTMLHHLVNMEQRLQTIEAEREKESKQATIMQNLVNSLHNKIKGMENEITNLKQSQQEELRSIHEIVTKMLNEVPQSDCVSNKFEEIEDSVNDLSNKLEAIEDLQERVSLIETCENSSDRAFSSQSLTCPNDLIAELSNEMEERQKRKNSIVIHNVPESISEQEDSDAISDILKEVIGEKANTDECNIVRSYRMGRRHPSRGRSIKVHFTSSAICEHILENARKLVGSNKHKSVVLQKDLTTLERLNLKKLVMEKRKRNLAASNMGLEADWIIHDNFLCRKSDLYSNF